MVSDLDSMFEARCRHCAAPVHDVVIDLGMHPLCESYLSRDQLNRMEPFYPLVVMVCRNCWLVQLEQYVEPGEIFSEYAYFSSYAASWVEHARKYVEGIVRRLELDEHSRVIEIASNDGYLLQHFLPLGIPVLGVEPAANVARAAQERGVPTLVEFFGTDLAKHLAERGRADLLIGNNVLAQVPDLNDFVAGLALLLKPGGTITLEFPHLVNLIEQNQFDTIYHEHFSYFTATAVRNVLSTHGLTIYDVEQIPSHGGSLRVYATDSATGARECSARVGDVLAREQSEGYLDIGKYLGFDEQVRETKRTLLELLIRIKRHGGRIAGYGAPGKGNTLLNFCGIGKDFLDFTVDRNPYKQGRFLPGTHIPILSPDWIEREKPDYVLILPWNFKEEIKAQMKDIRSWGGQFIVPVPGASIEE